MRQCHLPWAISQLVYIFFSFLCVCFSNPTCIKNFCKCDCVTLNQPIDPGNISGVPRSDLSQAQLFCSHLETVFSYSCFFVFLQRRQLPVDHRASFSGRMVQLFEAFERSRAGGHVEPLVHREGDVQEERPKQYSAAGDHHTAVSGDSTGMRVTQVDPSKLNE